MNFSFRAKTILGIALIEAVLLSILIYSTLSFLHDSNETQFATHVETTRNVFTSLISDEVLVADLAELDSAVNLLGKNPGVSFVRILDSQNRVLAEAGEAEALARPFTASVDLNDAANGVYRTASVIEMSGVNFAVIQFGFDESFLQKTFVTAKRWSVAIALIEMGLVAVFSMLLGGYLIREINQFTAGARQISTGVLGLQLPVHGDDEIAEATRAFNAMSMSIKTAHDSLDRQVKERTGELEQSNNHLRNLLNERATLLDSQTVGLVTLQARTVIWCNSTFLQMMGYADLAELKGKTTRLFYAHEEDFVAVGQTYQRNGNLHELKRDFEFIRKDGKLIWVDLSGTQLPVEGQSLWVIVDVTDRVRSQQALERSEKKFRALFESTSEAILIVDGEDFVDCNSAAVRMFGAHSKEEICRVVAGDLSPAVQPCGTESLILSKQWMARAYAEGSVRFDWVHHRLDSRQSFPAEVLLSLVPFDGRQALLAVVWDVSERQAMMEKIRRQANFDHLTGMCNRRYFMDLAERELERARRYQKPLAILGVDIDYFKRINDNYGHKAGDLALQKFAVTCHEVVRQTDLVGRMGGEEFAILLPETDPGRAREIAERLRKRVEESELSLPDDETVLRFTISIGLALLAAGEKTELDALLHKADMALYQAKNAGRNRVLIAE